MIGAQADIAHVQTHRLAPSLFGLIVGLLATAPLRALVIEGGATTANERFSAGFPGAPVANPDPGFLGADLDFSGIGWLTGSPQFALTLISPQHFVITAHTTPAVGSGVSFLNQTGAVKNYTVESTHAIAHSLGENTDIAIGRLSAPIASSDAITSYPLLRLDTYDHYLNLPLLVYGGNGRIGRNHLDAFYLADMLPFGRSNGVPDSVLFSTDQDSIAGESQGEVGDSGSPSLYLAGSTLALVGIHSAIDTMPPLNDRTFDSFLPSYGSQIQSLLALDGYALAVIPEPAAVAGLIGLAGLVVLRRRRSAGGDLPGSPPPAL